MEPIQQKSMYARQIWEAGVLYYLELIQKRLPLNIPPDWIQVRECDWMVCQDLEPPVAAVHILLDRTFGVYNDRISKLEAICAQAARIIEAHGVTPLETQSPSSTETAESAAEHQDVYVDENGKEEPIPPKGKLN